MQGQSQISEFWPGGPRLKEDPEVFRLCADSVLLADFAASARSGAEKRAIDLGCGSGDKNSAADLGCGSRASKRAIDLGCGSGVIALLLAWNDPELYIEGIDISKRAAQLASENFALNALAKRASAIERDLRRYREFYEAGSFDLAISNPPFFSPGGGRRPAKQWQAEARGGESCTIDDLCRAAGYLVRPGGSFALAHKPAMLCTVFRSLGKYGLEPKRLRFVHHTRSSAPCLALIGSRAGGKPSLKVEAPLILKDDDGGDSDEMKAIYRII